MTPQNLPPVIPIPAICENPQCKAVFLYMRQRSATPAAVVRMQGCKAGPCPNCNGVGRIPDGAYTLTQASLYSRTDLETVLAGLNAIAQKVSAGATADEVAKEITDKHPALEGLTRYMPKDAPSLAAYLAILATITSALITQCAHPPAQQPINIYVQEELAEAIGRANAGHNATPPKKHESPPPPKHLDI